MTIFNRDFDFSRSKHTSIDLSLEADLDNIILPPTVDVLKIEKPVLTDSIINKGSSDAINTINVHEEAALEQRINKVMPLDIAKELTKYLSNMDIMSGIQNYKITGITDFVPGLTINWPKTFAEFQSRFTEVGPYGSASVLTLESMEYLYGFFKKLYQEKIFMKLSDRVEEDILIEKDIVEPPTSTEIYGTDSLTTLEDGYLQPDLNFTFDLYGDSKVPDNPEDYTPSTEDLGEAGTY